MVNINWGAAMAAAQEGRLAEFFSRLLERKDDTEREKIAYKVDGFTQFTEDYFRKFAEDYAYLLGVNEGLATLDVIQDGVKNWRGGGESSWPRRKNAMLTPRICSVRVKKLMTRRITVLPHACIKSPMSFIRQACKTV